MRTPTLKPSWHLALTVGRFALLLLPGGIPIFLLASWLMRHQARPALAARR